MDFIDTREVHKRVVAHDLRSYRRDPDGAAIPYTATIVSRLTGEFGVPGRTTVYNETALFFHAAEDHSIGCEVVGWADDFDAIVEAVRDGKVGQNGFLVD